MATIRTDKKTTMYVNVEVGADSYKNRTFQNVNPALTDDKCLYFGNKLGTLQTHTVNLVKRRDEAVLIAE